MLSLYENSRLSHFPKRGNPLLLKIKLCHYRYRCITPASLSFYQQNGNPYLSWYESPIKLALPRLTAFFVTLYFGRRSGERLVACRLPAALDVFLFSCLSLRYTFSEAFNNTIAIGWLQWNHFYSNSKEETKKKDLIPGNDSTSTMVLFAICSTTHGTSIP